MCKPASFVVVPGPRVYWDMSDSHENIISVNKLHADGVCGPNLVRVEVSPPKGDLSLPLRDWVYRVDQDTLPEWYDAAAVESATRVALVDWAEKKLSGWKVEEAFNPVNPLLIKRKKMSKERMTELLAQWASVWDSVRYSVWDSVGASVGASVRASVGASVGAYIGDLFPNIREWEGAEKLGPDPWRPLLTLWYAGYIPSYDGTTWRLHAGPKAEVVFEIKGKEGE